MLTPTHGRVGFDRWEFPRDVAFLRGNLGYVPQGAHLTAREWLAPPVWILDEPPGAQPRLAADKVVRLQSASLPSSTPRLPSFLSYRCLPGTGQPPVPGVRLWMVPFAAEWTTYPAAEERRPRPVG